MLAKTISVTQQDNLKNKPKFLFYFGSALVSLIFAYIVNKNLELPQIVLRPIAVAGLSFLLFSAFYRPFIPFLVLVIYSPFAKVLVGDFATDATALNLTNILFFICIIASLSYAFSYQGKRQGWPMLSYAITLFIFWGITSLIFGTFHYGSVYAENFLFPLKRWLSPILLYFFTLHFVKDKNSFKRVVIIIMLVTVIMGIMAAKDYLDVKDSGSLDSSRVAGVFGNPNTLAGFFIYNMFLFLGFFFAYFPNFRYFALLLPFVICFRGIQVTFSRGGYIAFAVGSMAATFFKSRIIFIIAASILIAAVLNPALLPAGIRNRMESTFYSDKIITTDVSDVKDKSAQKRFEIWRGAIQMVKEHPTFGVGYGVFAFMIPNYADVGYVDAHNTYLILAAEMGIPALLIFLIILALMIKNSFWLYCKVKDKFIRAFALGMLGGLFGLLAVNLFGSRLNSEEVSAYFWVYAGLIMAAVRMKQLKKIA